MDKYEIITHPNPFLRRKAKKVSVFDKDFQDLIEDMFVIMREAPGVGLAAPQIGVSALSWLNMRMLKLKTPSQRHMFWLIQRLFTILMIQHRIWKDV